MSGQNSAQSEGIHIMRTFAEMTACIFRHIPAHYLPSQFPCLNTNLQQATALLLFFVAYSYISCDMYVLIIFNLGGFLGVGAGVGDAHWIYRFFALYYFYLYKF